MHQNFALAHFDVKLVLLSTLLYPLNSCDLILISFKNWELNLCSAIFFR